MHTEIGIWPLIFYLQQCILSTVSIDIKSNFLVGKNKRINATAYEEAIARSNIICAGTCVSSSNCTAASYNPDARKCYLFDKMCYLEEDAPGWSHLSFPPVARTFNYISNQTLTWDNAKMYCESIGGGLANVLTTTDHEEILNTINQFINQSESKVQVWLGGTDRDIEGEWIWSNGCRFDDQGFTFWNTGEPNNVNENEHCMALRTPVFKWNDLNCATNKTFVCENTVLLT